MPECEEKPNSPARACQILKCLIGCSYHLCIAVINSKCIWSWTFTWCKSRASMAIRDFREKLCSPKSPIPFYVLWRCEMQWNNNVEIMCDMLLSLSYSHTHTHIWTNQEKSSHPYAASQATYSRSRREKKNCASHSFENGEHSEKCSNIIKTIHRIYYTHSVHRHTDTGTSMAVFADAL